ncbi:alpha/beta hydrolase [Enemella evansiae]|uniref:Alpha/beta hydrolase n=1 Tax=Enemella evansiae TaxID=2016499 RepID=A0A255GQ45_9ACTN|nr:alpha/beta hydrolase [Enemella evansiae]OYO17929.1 alpha/beta hydrolase [Enemella evansiae]
MPAPSPLSALPALPEPDLVQLDGVPVATYRLEPGTGPVPGELVICHGTPWSARVWAGVAAQAAAAGWRVFLWDMPGYGRSVMSAEVPVDLAAQMRRLAALLEHWGLDRPHLLAHDIGGAVALGAHLLHDREYAELRLWDVVTLDPWGSPFFRLVAEHAAVFAQLPPNLHRALVREYIAGAVYQELPEPVLAGLTEPWLSEAGRPAFYRQIAQLSPEHTRPLVERLGAVRCPVAIGWGERDPWIPVEQAYRLRDALPGVPELTLLPAAGHLAPLEDPEGVRRALADWLSISRGDW